MLAGMSPRENPLHGKKETLLQHQKETLGSDGETSDYQRSTPSPRDGDTGIPELITEGKSPTPYSLPRPHPSLVLIPPLNF